MVMMEGKFLNLGKYLSPEEAIERFCSLQKALGLTPSQVADRCNWVREYLKSACSKPECNVYDLSVYDGQDYLLDMSEQKNFSDITFNCIADAIADFYIVLLHIRVSEESFCRRNLSGERKNYPYDRAAWEIIDQCPDPMIKAVLVLMLFCNLSLEEISHLRFGNIDKKQRCLITDAALHSPSRLISYSEMVRYHLNKYCRQSGMVHQPARSYVFCYGKNREEPLSPLILSKRIQTCLQKYSAEPDYLLQLIK